MSTFPSNPNSIPNKLGIPYPPITLRRNAGRTPGHRTRRNSLRSPLRKAVRNLPRRVWRRATRAPGRDTGHTTRHHPEPTPTSTNTPHHSTPEKYAGKARGWVGMGGRGGARSQGGRDRGDGDIPVTPPPSSTAPENELKRPTDPAPYRDWSPPKKPPTQLP